jgi:hypothetical protein
MRQYKPVLVRDLVEIASLEHWIDYEFASAVADKLRGAKLGQLVGDPKYLCVYYPDDRYAMGAISKSVHKDGRWRYEVTSPHIHNQRSSISSINTKSSTHIDVAVRNAARYLKRQSSIDDATLDVKKLNRAVGNVVRIADQEFQKIATNLSDGFKSTWRSKYDATNNLPDQGEFIHEFKHMVATYEFVNPNIGELFTNLITTYDNQESAKRSSKDTYVYIRLISDNRVVMVSGVQVTDHRRDNPEQHNVVTRTTDDQIPEYIQNTVATLFMLQDGEFVDGLGMRVDESTYYVLEQ